jgi:hypothetical protein
MSSHVTFVIDDLLPPPSEVGAWYVPQPDEEEIEAKVVKRGRPRKVSTTEGVETK